MSDDAEPAAGALAALFDYSVVQDPPDDDMIAWLAYLAGVDTGAIAAEFQRGGPLALATARLLGFQKFQPVPPLPPKKRGRREDFAHDHQVNRVVREFMDEGLSEADAIQLAPRKLYDLGVHNRRRIPMPLTERSIRRALARYPRLWLEGSEDNRGH